MTSIPTLALAAACALPLFLSLPATAQTAVAATVAPMDHAAHAAPSGEMADGEIRKISKETGKLTIKHGPLKSLDMPPMTMVFVAKDPAMLDKLAVGDKVRFAVVDQDGQMVVTELQPAQ